MEFGWELFRQFTHGFPVFHLDMIAARSRLFQRFKVHETGTIVALNPKIQSWITCDASKLWVDELDVFRQTKNLTRPTPAECSPRHQKSTHVSALLKVPTKHHHNISKMTFHIMLMEMPCLSLLQSSCFTLSSSFISSQGNSGATFEYDFTDGG